MHNVGGDIVDGVLEKVTPMDEYILQAVFTGGIVKRYDVKPLLDKIEWFQAMKDEPKIFYQVKVDIGGYGVSWDDEMDLAAEEIWDNGITV